ncbi:MAG: 16S rRNA (cytosine(967)-C(5))-methyltransferase RsmB [Candidatus Cloacimonadota bacterium]|nr:MAG: 16S rRNA (cytosine(967)-C(5))-methyltransferase RsmB [Candidatus Cloacimonadota bacterium]PIE79268.1 MAG: 16S rRNA (cytosine(967)-C(5))-methyltransferase RsmB [Candidatus Delongbacteria bacterium]
MNLRKLYYNTVVRIFDENLLFKSFYKEILPELSSDERRLFINMVNNFFRHFRYVEKIFIERVEKKIDRDKYLVVMLLLSAGCEWLYLDKSKSYAIVNEYVEIAKKRFGSFKAGFVNAVLRKFIKLDKEELLANQEDIYISHPEWFINEIKKSYTPKIAREILKFNQEIPKTYIRHNRTKTTVKRLLADLESRNIEAKKVKQFPDYICVKKGNIFDIDLFEKGEFYIQSPSHSLPIKLLNPVKGEKILDICSAPGGKSTHIQEITFNKVKLFLNDISMKKRVKIKHNFKRLGLSFEKLTFQEGEKFKLFMDFDKILIDAPCSGTGNFGKHPEARWNRDKEDIEDLIKLQYKILDNASYYLKINGTIIYSTCSILDSENIKVVEKFTKNNPDFIIEKPSEEFDKYRYKDNYLLVNPGISRLDGGFCCKIRRIR